MNAPAMSRIEGLILAEVVDLDDPEKLGRIKVTFPTLSPDQQSDWSPILRPLASGGFGMWIQPLVGDLVVVACLGGRIEQAVILGSIYHGDAKPPSEKPEQRMLVTGTGHSVLLDDTSGEEAIIITDAKGSTVTMNKDGITLESSKDVVIKGQNVTIEASAQLTGKGQPIHLNP